MKRNGFTLVEMMAVIVLVALLAVIGVATYTNVNEAAKEKTLESKKEQIRAAGIKWAKENNINYKTIISVNALVVEGYLTAEENEVGKIGVIENPVTGENMICNTVDISLKDGEYIAVLNDKEQNCTLATQSLVDTNINIKVVDEKNKDVTGSGSIAKWSNQNVMIIVSSSSYDSRATSISYDFEGNTVTKQKSGKQKYTGNAYISEPSADNYYNVFHVNANLILNTKIIVTYNIAGENSKSRAYTIRIDKEEATATVSSNSEWLTVDKDVYITVDDGKGSGPKYFYITKTETLDLNTAIKKQADYKTKVTGLDIGKYYVWTEDVAGNKSTTYKIILELNNVDKTVPACEVLFHGHEGNNGWYKEVPVTPGGKNTVKAGISGMNLGVNTIQNDPEYTAFAQYNTFNEALGTARTTETTRDGVNYYCHVKTLAGNYANASRNLKLDMTPPTFTIDSTTDTNYTKRKSVSFTITDNLSGLGSDVRLRYTWALNSPSGEQKPWTTIAYSFTGTVTTLSDGMTGAMDMTGKYYLLIDFSNVQDIAGNKATGVNGGGSGGIASFGPFYFDNTPPVCDGNNGKTTWTSGGYTINQLCADNDGTNDQSGCKKRTYTTMYYAFQNVMGDQVTIEDKAGNTTVCDYNVYIDNETPACGTNNGKSNWTRGSWTGNQYCTDGYSGCAKNPFSYTWTSSTNQSSITISDNVGHTRSCPISVRLDTDAPTCSIGAKSTGLTISCSDSGGSGNSSCHFDSNGTDVSKALAIGTFEGYTTDVAGNSGTCSRAVWSTYVSKYSKYTNTCKFDNYTRTIKTCSRSVKDYTETTKTCKAGTTTYYFGSMSYSNVSSCSSNTFDCDSSHSGQTYVSCSKNYTYYLDTGTTNPTASSCTQSTWSCNYSHLDWYYVDCTANTNAAGIVTSYKMTQKACKRKESGTYSKGVKTCYSNTPYSFGPTSTNTVSSCTNNTFNCDSSHANNTYRTCSTNYNYYTSTSTDTKSTCSVGESYGTCAADKYTNSYVSACTGNYSFHSSTDTDLTSCETGATFTCDSNTNGSSYVYSCLPTEYSCATGTKLTDSYCA